MRTQWQIREKDMTTTWVLVADSARARLFSKPKGEPGLTEIRSFVNPDARSPASADATSAPPTVHERMGPARHSIEPHTSVEQKRRDEFARLIAQALGQGRVEGAFANLVLVAAPRMLGTLRESLDSNVRDCVSAEIAKDYTSLRAEEILGHLPQAAIRGSIAP